MDPGAKTGVCVYDTDTGFLAIQIIPDGLAGIQNYWYWHTDLENAVRTGELTFVCESFEAEEGTHGIDLTPVEIIGWLKGIGVPIQWQRRNQRGKGKLISTAVLKRAGLYPKRGELKEGHQVAALQHALAYLVKIRHRETIELLHPKEES